MLKTEKFLGVELIMQVKFFASFYSFTVDNLMQVKYRTSGH